MAMIAKAETYQLIDEQQRKEALDPQRSFIVQAPAGSGKTELLVSRYLKLLSAVERPESVVAITFTRKAAGEMRKRVIDALEKPEGRVGEYARAALEKHGGRGCDLTAEPWRLNIQTIDALCSVLTRQMPVASRFGSHPEVIEDARDLYLIAARNALKNLAENGESGAALFRRVSIHFDGDLRRLEEKLTEMLARRDQWRVLGAGVPATVRDFCELLEAAENSLREVFRDRSKVDFIEVTRAAIAALGTDDQPSDLLYALDYRIEHLLVDEVQDISHVQYDFLERLTAEWSDDASHTLFLVGDPVQSIYGFREADVGLFLRCMIRGQLGSVRLTPVHLQTNFRSTKALVDWTQDAFTRILEQDDPAIGAVKLNPCEAVREGGASPSMLCFVNDDGSREARAIVDVLRSVPNPSKTAILVRARTHLRSILPALRNAGIDYQAVKIDRLGEVQHIVDLVSITRALVHAADRIAWLACLRAPWCGLTVGDFAALAEYEADHTILDLLSDPEKIASLSPDGRLRAVRFQESMSRAVSQFGHMRLRDLVESTWVSLGGPATLDKLHQREDAETYFNVLEEFEQGGTIPDFSLFEEKLSEVCARPRMDENCLKVMTIHDAKGLEFDTVIVPQLGAKTRSDSTKDLVIWTEEVEEGGFVRVNAAALPQRGGLDQEYKRIEEVLKLKAREEMKRLLYVAVTRSANRLYLSGNVTTATKTGALSEPGKDTFLNPLWEVVKEQFEGELHAVRARTSSTTQVRTTICRLPAGWTAPEAERPVSWQPEFVRSAASAREITYEWVSDVRRHVGTVTHGILKRIAAEGLTAWGRERIQSSAPLIESELTRLGVSRTELSEATRDIMRAVGNMANSVRGKWILEAHADARTEWPIVGRIKDALVSGTIDRMFRDAEGRLWIIDYKIGEHEGGSREHFLDEEKRRYQSQLESYAVLASRLDPGSIWLGLYYPLIDGWREWRFEEEAAMAASDLYTSE